ncbi:MAG: hypothetical protein EAZ57_01990 [Cytophagales bacterium]|nr:MAG: hypothetical protein EAZ67_02600 [Cytophagales bacterium]TAF61893.1 MAG: hypothetical protein EAZ57_01990 [Cytophagales bacterium]
MKKLAIVGSGDLGQLMAHHALAANMDVVAFYDDFKPKNDRVKNIPVLGGLDAVIKDFHAGLFEQIAVGVGYKHLVFKQDLINNFIQEKIPLANIIHPTAYIDSSAHLGVGIFVLPRCVVDAGVTLGDGVLLNTGVCVAHDTTIGPCSFIAPAAALAGFIQLGERCFVGTNSTLIDNLTIISDTRIGAGAVVTTNINQPGLYVGMPARKIK